MKKITFGVPEKIVPSAFCKNLRYEETAIDYDTDKISFRQTPRGCVLEFPMSGDEHFYGLGLQLKQFDFTGRHVRLKVNADPVAATGDSHAPVPFFVSTKGYGVRPVLVIQNDTGNKYSPTTIVAAITSRQTKTKLPTHIEIGEGVFEKDSVVLLEQIRTVDKRRLKGYVGTLDNRTISKVNRAIAVSVALGKKTEGDNDVVSGRKSIYGRCALRCDSAFDESDEKAAEIKRKRDFGCRE